MPVSVSQWETAEQRRFVDGYADDDVAFVAPRGSHDLQKQARHRDFKREEKRPGHYLTPKLNLSAAEEAIFVFGGKKLEVFFGGLFIEVLSNADLKIVAAGDDIGIAAGVP